MTTQRIAHRHLKHDHKEVLRSSIAETCSSDEKNLQK
jgi:hypothetical protein